MIEDCEVAAWLRGGRTDDLIAWLVEGFPGRSSGPFAAAIWQPGNLSILSPPGERTGPVVPLGCIQDAMLGALFCALADEGRLSLDDAIAHHLPELSDTADGPDVPRLSHLLSHSTGLWLDKPRSGASMPQAWSELSRLIVPRFTPGSLTAHSLLERIMLLQVAERATGRPAYAELRERLTPASTSLVLRPPDGQLAGCYAEIHGTLADCAAFLDAAAQTSWFDRVQRGEILAPITQSPSVRPWAPVADGLGLFRLANGLLGQDGDHPTRGFVGLRLASSGRLAVMGHFRSSPERDHVLNRLASDVMDVAPPPKSAVLGDLNGFDPAELTGTYRGLWGTRQLVEAAEGQLRVAASRDLGALPIDIQPDGSLTGRWAAPNLWIEPQRLSRDDLIGFRFGKHLYVKDRHDGRLHDD